MLHLPAALGSIRGQKDEHQLRFFAACALSLHGTVSVVEVLQDIFSTILGGSRLQTHLDGIDDFAAEDVGLRCLDDYSGDE